eukprot:gene17971-36679_t
MRIWLVNRPDTVIGAYWPIKGEFDPLPALHRWKEDGELLDEPQLRRIGLPVVNKQHKTLTFHAWYPGCPMEEDAYGIPKPKDTEVIVPTLLFVPCVGYAAGGYRLGYGGGFYDRTLATLQPKPFTVGLGFTHGFLDDFEPEEFDLPLDAILNDNGVVVHRVRVGHLADGFARGDGLHLQPVPEGLDLGPQRVARPRDEPVGHRRIHAVLRQHLDQVA